MKRLLALVASAATPRHLRSALVAALPLLAGPRLPEDAAGGDDDAGGALGRRGAWSSGRQLNPAGARGRSGSFALKPGGPAVPSAIPSASRALAGALLAAAAPSAAASALASEERAAALRALPPPSCFFCLGGRGQAGGSSLEQAGQGEADALRMPFKAWPFETAYQVRCFNGYKLERESLHSLSTLPLGANYYFKKSLLSFYASTLFPSSVSLSVCLSLSLSLSSSPFRRWRFGCVSSVCPAKAAPSRSSPSPTMRTGAASASPSTRAAASACE